MLRFRYRVCIRLPLHPPQLHVSDYGWIFVVHECPNSFLATAPPQPQPNIPKQPANPPTMRRQLDEEEEDESDEEFFVRQPEPAPVKQAPPVTVESDDDDDDFFVR